MGISQGLSDGMSDNTGLGKTWTFNTNTSPKAEIRVKEIPEKTTEKKATIINNKSKSRFFAIRKQRIMQRLINHEEFRDQSLFSPQNYVRSQTPGNPSRHCTPLQQHCELKIRKATKFSKEKTTLRRELMDQGAGGSSTISATNVSKVNKINLEFDCEHRSQLMEGKKPTEQITGPLLGNYSSQEDPSNELMISM